MEKLDARERVMSPRERKASPTFRKNVVSHLLEAKRVQTSEALQQGQKRIIVQSTTQLGTTYLIGSSDEVIWEP